MEIKKTFLDKGKFRRGTSQEKADLHLPSSSDVFSVPTNLIPGVGGVSGGRVILGTKSVTQAVSLVHREAPLVRSSMDLKGPSFVNQLGKFAGCVYAKEEGTVTHVDADKVTVRGKTSIDYELYEHHAIGRKSFIHNQPVVKVGDRVKAGQLLASSNYTDKKGNLALGINLRAAVMPYRSYNFEDAFVVSDSAAKKLQAEQVLKVSVVKKFGVETGKNKFISLFPNRFTNAQLSKIGEDGVIRKGEKVKMGDPLVLAFSPRTLKTTELQLGKLSKALKFAYRDNSETWDYEHDGEIVDVGNTGDHVQLHIRTVRGFLVGDKLSNTFGAKGVCAAVIPDAQMPTGEDGKPVEVILNSMSITSRVAPALAVTMAMGKYAEKTGRAKKMTPFTDGSAIGKAIDLLKKNNIKDVEDLYDPATGKKIKALVGPLYLSRLHHIAEDKISERGQGIAYDWNMQPGKAGDENSKRIGNLSTAALLSHNAKNVLEDIATVRATKNDEYWRRLKMGLPVPSPKSPFVFDKFLSSLQGAGVNVRKDGHTFSILPQTDADVEKMSSGVIENALTYKVKKDKLEPEKGGLFDPGLTGVVGDRYNHINLNMPVPNPISEEYLRKLLKVTQKQYEDMVVSGELEKQLKSINVDKEIGRYQQYLKTGKVTERDNAVKLLSFLQMLKKNNLTPDKLMMHKVLIIPAQFRPIALQGDMVMPAGVNLLYKDLILHNESLKNLQNVPEDLQKKVRMGQYEAVKAVFGVGDPITTKSQEKNVRGLLATSLGLHGGSAKGSVFQAKVVNKPMDLVGRGVLAGNASLNLDEASIPQDIMWKTYAPFIMRRLVRQGVPASQAFDFVEKRNLMAQKALQEESRERPAIISRDPALHKFNLTGFYVKPNADPKDYSIKLNPLVFKGLNADQDGDALNISVPAGDKARQEVIDKMLPSRNLLSPRNFGPMYVPSNESALGLFQASSENNKNTPIKFKTVQDVLAAFNAGKLDVGDVVEIG